VTVIWEQRLNATAPYRVLARRKSGGSFATEAELFPEARFSDRGPVIAADDAGNVSVVAENTRTHSILLRRFDVASSSWQEPVTVSTAPPFGYRASVGASAGGDLLIVFSRNKDTGPPLDARASLCELF
jgi:hypothetical protein